jgi:hypothetical protein
MVRHPTQEIEVQRTGRTPVGRPITAATGLSVFPADTWHAKMTAHGDPESPSTQRLEDSLELGYPTKIGQTPMQRPPDSLISARTGS